MNPKLKIHVTVFNWVEVYIYPGCSLIVNVRWSAVSGCYILLVWRTLMHLDISQEFDLVIFLLLIDLQ